MTKSIGMLMAAAVAGLASITLHSAANAAEDHDYDIDAEGKFTDYPGKHRDKCEIKLDDYKFRGFYVNIYPRGDYIFASCKFRLPHKFKVVIKDYKCKLIDKNDYEYPEVLYAKKSIFFAKHGWATSCVSLRKKTTITTTMAARSK